MEPRGPGNNGAVGKARGSRIEAGQYPLGTHGHTGSKYATYGYHSASPPRPGLHVHDTNVRSAILIHRGVGFKASVRCINLTGSISGPVGTIDPGTSYARLDALIRYMRANVAGFPPSNGHRIPKAWLVIEGEP